MSTGKESKDGAIEDDEDEQSEGSNGMKDIVDTADMQLFENPLANTDKNVRFSKEEKAKGPAIVTGRNSTSSKRKVAETNPSPLPAEKLKTKNFATGRGSGSYAIGQRIPISAQRGRGAGRGGKSNANNVSVRNNTEGVKANIKAHHKAHINPNTKKEEEGNSEKQQHQVSAVWIPTQEGDALKNPTNSLDEAARQPSQSQ